MLNYSIIEVDADAAFFAGHFPGDPIVPGAYLLARITDVVLARINHCGPVELANAKFTALVRPGDQLKLQWEYAQNSQTKPTGSIVQFTLLAREIVAVTGALKISPTS